MNAELLLVWVEIAARLHIYCDDEFWERKIKKKKKKFLQVSQSGLLCRTVRQMWRTMLI